MPLRQGFAEIYDGWHLALYVADFSRAYQALADMGLIFNDHPFFDKVHSLQEALQCHQFRFQVLPSFNTPA